MRILIAGCGYVGNALAEMLVALGHDVHGLRRNIAALPPGVSPIAADLARGEGLEGLPEDLDVVVYAVGAEARTEAAYQAAYLDGQRNLGAALARFGGVPRYVFVSSTAVYGQDDGSWVDEDSLAAPAAFNGRLMLEAEALARDAAPRSVVVRFGGIYGPGRRWLIDSVRAGRPVSPESAAEYTNRIHRDDCAGVLTHILRLGAPSSLYVGVDDEPAPRHEVLGWLAERLGVPTPPGSRAGRAASASGKRCRNDRIRGAGYAFRYPTYREGYAAMLAPAD